MRMFVKNLVLLLLAGLLAGSCQSATETQNNNGEPVVVISTPFGEMRAILYDQTPRHKENFLKLIAEGFYDSLLFHRVIPGFMVQGGDPQSKNAPAGVALGNGGPGYTIPAEIFPNLFHHKGALAAARLGDQVNPQKASSGSQFYIVHGRPYRAEELEMMQVDINRLNALFTQYVQRPGNEAMLQEAIALENAQNFDALQQMALNAKDMLESTFQTELDKPFAAEQTAAYTSIGGTPGLDREYTVFGRVISGLEVVDKIAAVPTAGANRPIDNVWMTVRIERMSREQIAKDYGYQF